MKLLLKASSNSFVGNSALIFLSRFFPTLASTAIAIYFSHKLDTEVYGTYVNFWTRLFLISTFACLGLQGFLMTYTPVVIAKLIRMLSVKTYILLVVWVLVTAGIFACYQQSGYLLPFLFLIIYSVSVIIETILMVFRNLRILIWINLLYAVIFCYLHYLFIAGAFSLDNLFWYIMVLAAIKLGVYFICLYHDVVNLSSQQEEIPDLKGVRSLWLHMGLYDVMQVAFKWIDKFIISLLFTASISAVYFNGSIDVPFLPLIMGAVGSAALMQLSADTSTDAPQVVVNKSGRILSSIVFPLFFFLLFFRYEFINFIFSHKYQASVPIFLVSILMLPLRAYNFTVILQNKHRGDIINKGAIADLVIACILIYPLYLWMGLPGVALSFVISTYAQAGYYIYHTARILQLSWLRLIPLINWLTKLIVFATLFIAIHYLLSKYYTAQIVLICGILMALFISGIALLLEIRATKRIYGATQEA